MKYRDRDAPVTCEGLIFRTYGYDHPLNSCFCDLEYAPETQTRSEDPRALRNGLNIKYYKFYFDAGLRFAMEQEFPYTLYHRPLNQEIVGIKDAQIAHVVRPDQCLRNLLALEGDPLVESCREVLDLVTDNSTLNEGDFGVFGSLAHGFYNPMYSDIDLIIYGIDEHRELRATLEELYLKGLLRNEFEDWSLLDPPHHWYFTHYSKKEYGSYQERKKIYAIYRSKTLDREVKVEFEPVRRWEEITNEYETTIRIENLGRIEAIGEILSDEEGGFIPSIYPVRLKEINADVPPRDVCRIISFIEEFRLQLEAGENVLVRGDLEKVETREEEFYQITLSYGEGYFDQVLKAVET